MRVKVDTVVPRYNEPRCNDLPAKTTVIFFTVFFPFFVFVFVPPI